MTLMRSWEEEYPEQRSAHERAPGLTFSWQGGDHGPERCPRLAFKQRKNVLMMDTWLEEALSFSGRGAM